MKYQNLNSQELKALEKEFIQFLSSNTITKDDWETLKKEQSEKVNQLISLFSDIVWEKILDQTQYLQQHTEKTLQVYYCGAKEIHLRKMTISKGDADFNKHTLPEIANMVNNKSVDVSIGVSKKTYNTDRNEEVFSLFQLGCRPANSDLFNALTVKKE